MFHAERKFRQTVNCQIKTDINMENKTQITNASAISSNGMLNAGAEIQALQEKIITEEIKKREQFLINHIEKHCSWWQRKYVKLAMKFRFLNIWFIKNCVKNVPHELNSEFMGLNFGTQQQYGCEINGKVYWMQ